MSEDYIEHDDWNTSLPSLPRQSRIELGPISGVLAYEGVRNPGFRSATRHTIWLTYKTLANDWKPKVGICESAAEAACGHEILVADTTYDVQFQPLKVRYLDEHGKRRSHTHDLLFVSRCGHRRLIFVRNGTSLAKAATDREIRQVVTATPPSAADDMIILNADAYTRQRRENLFRMHSFVFQPDDEADEIVDWTARRLKTLWLMCDLFEHVEIAQARVFRSCYRLVAQRRMSANLDHVLNEHSRIEVR